MSIPNELIENVPYQWESLQQYKDEIGNYKRFPINSEHYWSASNKRWKRTIFVGRRAGEFKGTVEGIYTVHEAREVFLKAATEYEAAMMLVTNWEHWVSIKESLNNKRYIDEWMLEKELADIARTKNLLWKAANRGNVSAQKILLDGFDKDKKLIKSREEEHTKDKRAREEESSKVQMIKESLRLVSKA